MEKDTRYELLDKASISADQISRPSVSYWKDAWRRFRKDKLAMFGLVMILIVSLFAIFGPMLCPYDYDEADFLSIAQWPSKAQDVYKRQVPTAARSRDLKPRHFKSERFPHLSPPFQDWGAFLFLHFQI